MESPIVWTCWNFAFDLYRRQMKEPLKAAGIEWEGWHGFGRGLATNERIGVRESIAAMVLRHSNDRVTRKHYIKPPTLEAVAAMRRLSETLLALDKRKCSPIAPQKVQKSTRGKSTHVGSKEA
jgi:hypothetical protein